MELPELVTQLYKALPYGMSYQAVACLADDGILFGDGDVEQPQVLLQPLKIPLLSVSRRLQTVNVLLRPLLYGLGGSF